MSKKLIDFTLNRAGWGNGQSLDLDVGQIETVCDPETLPNLLRVTANGPCGSRLAAAHTGPIARPRHRLSTLSLIQRCGALGMSRFCAQKRDIPSRHAQSEGMDGHTQHPIGTRQVASWIRRRIENGGERLWRFDDFPGAPVAAVAQALSRLARGGKLERLSKGVYYRPRQTALGKSRPNPAAIRKLAADRDNPLFPAGMAAANLLGFTTQSASRGEVATSGFRLPRKLLGDDTVVHTRRPEAWKKLTETDAALLDFLRRAGRTSELSLDDTIKRTLALCCRFDNVKRTHPDRVKGTHPLVNGL